MRFMLLQACLTISSVLAWEYNSNEKLLSLTLDKYDLETDDNLPANLGEWSGRGNETIPL
jgi:hypothetical protein